MDQLTIPILLGTAREGRRSEQAAQYVLRQAQAYGFASQLIDAREFSRGVTAYAKDDPDRFRAWQAAMRAADGLIIVSPEYDHGYPGELKEAIDSLKEEYVRKPVGFCGVSSGGLGGARAVEQLRLVMIELAMVPIKHAVYFGNIKTLFAADGQIADSSYAERLTKMFDELIWYAQALRTARQSV